MPQFTEMPRPALWDETAAGGWRLTDPIVVGYDGSAAARRAVERAVAIAAPPGTVVLVAAAPALEDYELEAEVAASQPIELDRLLEDAAGFGGGRDLRMVTRVAKGDPVDVLDQVARELEARLIVVGARGDSFLARTLRGSVGERLVGRAPCDVLVVR